MPPLEPELAPDAEAIVVAFLLERADVAELVDDRVWTRTWSTGLPWVRIHQFSETEGQHGHLVTVHLQVDCFAGADEHGAQHEASLLSRTVKRALRQLPGVHGDAVVTAVDTGGRSRDPDASLQPARERYRFDAHVSVHATRPGS